jgi:putative oxidoreductase
MSNRLTAIAARMQEPAYAALRIVAGLMFSLHGAQKILGWLTTRPTAAVGSQSWVGGVIELVGGVLIAVGLFTRAAAFLASGTMAVAYVQFHWKLDLTAFKWLPIVNRGELAALYCFVFLFIAARGAGLASVDGLLSGRGRGRR